MDSANNARVRAISNIVPGPRVEVHSPAAAMVDCGLSIFSLQLPMGALRAEGRTPETYESKKTGRPT